MKLISVAVAISLPGPSSVRIWLSRIRLCSGIERKRGSMEEFTYHQETNKMSRDVVLFAKYLHV